MRREIRPARTNLLATRRISMKGVATEEMSTKGAFRPMIGREHVDDSPAENLTEF